MAALALALIEFSEEKNKRTYTLASHTATKPALLIQSKKVPQNGSALLGTDFKIVRASVDALGVPTSSKISLSFNGTYPVNCVIADIDAAIADFRAVVASDEFVTLVKAQTWVKP